MPNVATLLDEISERTIVQRVSGRHDTARMRYALDSNVVDTSQEFTRIITDYYSYHFATCVSGGGVLEAAEAEGRAKEALLRHYRQRGGDLVTAFNDAHDGTNGGMRAILDVLADGIKTEAVEHYLRSVFDRHVEPTSWEHKIEVIRQFIDHVGAANLPGIRADQPERYGTSFELIIKSFVAGMQRASAVFRRF